MYQVYLITLFLALIFASGLVQPAPLYEGNLETITFLPRERDVQYAPLQNIHNLTKENVMTEYNRVLECSQLVESLNAEMVSSNHSYEFIGAMKIPVLFTLSSTMYKSLLR